MQGLRNALRTEIEKSFNRSQLLLKVGRRSLLLLEDTGDYDLDERLW